MGGFSCLKMYEVAMIIIIKKRHSVSFDFGLIVQPTFSPLSFATCFAKEIADMRLGWVTRILHSAPLPS